MAKSLVVAGVMLFASVVPAVLMLAGSKAQAAEEKTSLHIELNNMQKSPKGCRLTFLMRNSLKPEISDLAFEIVLFDREARVARILALKSGALSSGKTRVKQFDIAGAPCTGISRILINSVESCQGEGLNAKACLAKLTVSTRTKTAFGL